jgi:hypothetical protein
MSLFVQVLFKGGLSMYKSKVSNGVNIEPIKDKPSTVQSMALSQFRGGVHYMSSTINGVGKQGDVVDIRAQCYSPSRFTHENMHVIT